MIAIRSLEHGEQLLSAGRLSCPACARAGLRAHGHSRTRTVRGPGESRLTLTPRRVRCPGCGATHVLLPTAVQARRADSTEVIGTALAAKARGAGARRIAAMLGRPVSTVRAWLRGATDGHADRLHQRGVAAAGAIDRDLLVRPAAQPSRLADALNLLAGAALAFRARLDLSDPPWTLIAFLAGGRLLPVLRT